jgi:hypothetical protein
MQNKKQQEKTREGKMDKKRLVEKMINIAGLPPQKISVCGLAKYIYGGKYPQLCRMSPAEINVITGWAEGADYSQYNIITI